jgi:hypothetical protein
MELRLHLIWIFILYTPCRPSSVFVIVTFVTPLSAILRRLIPEVYHSAASQAFPNFLVAFNGFEKMLNITKFRRSLWEFHHLLRYKRKECPVAQERNLCCWVLGVAVNHLAFFHSEHPKHILRNLWQHVERRGLVVIWLLLCIPEDPCSNVGPVTG